MTMTSQRESAKIYQFPVRERARTQVENPRPTRPASFPETTAAIVFDGAWYHEAAIREAELSGKR